MSADVCPWTVARSKSGALRHRRAGLVPMTCESCGQAERDHGTDLRDRKRGVVRCSWPAGPVLELLERRKRFPGAVPPGGVSTLADLSNAGRRAIYSGFLSDFRADEVAVALGRHPRDLWGPEWDHAADLPDADETARA